MILDRNSLCKSITEGQIERRNWNKNIATLLTVEVILKTKKIVQDALEDSKNLAKDRLQFCNINMTLEKVETKEAIGKDRDSIIRVDVPHFDIQILTFLKYKLFRLIHRIFSEIYPKLTDEDLLILSRFPLAAPGNENYSDAHKRFDHKIEEKREIIESLSTLLEKKTLALIKKRFMEMNSKIEAELSRK